VLDFRQLLLMMTKSTRFEKVQSPRGVLECPESSSPKFVAPTFELVAAGDSPLLILEAPGAVGKSTVAREISAALRWPMVHTERAQVGTSSLTGTFSSNLGYDTDYLQRFTRGEVGVVLDALDEAHLRAGSVNFFSFLDDVLELANATTSAQKSIVLLGRPETTELIRAFLEEKGVNPSVYRISFFSRTGANRLIETYLESRFADTNDPEYHIALAQPVPFARMRDLRLRQLGGVVVGKPELDLNRDWDEAKSFLGYAPVLIAVAESLAVKNPHAERIHGNSSEIASWSLLGDIVTRILAREQGKFLDNLHDKLHAHLSPTSGALPAELYSANEQVIRLFALSSGSDLVVAPPAKLPAELREIYDEAATLFTAEHPFMRGRSFASVVFADYVKAQCCVDPGSLASISGSVLQSGTATVGPFFLGFVFERLGDTSAVSESLITRLLSSWAQFTSVTGNGDAFAVLSLLGYQGSVSLPAVEAITGADPFIMFEVIDLSGALTLGDAPERAVIIASEGVILGRPGEPLVLSGDLVISAGEISIESELVNAFGAHGKKTVLLASALTANRLRQVAVRPNSALAVHCSTLPAKLIPFRPQQESLRLVSVGLQDYVSLRAILTAFRRTVHLGMSAPRVHLDKIMGQDVLRRGIVAALVKQKIIIDLGEWFSLDTNALGGVGFSLTDLKRGEPSDEITRFLQSVRDLLED
jgi:hypothetical protein